MKHDRLAFGAQYNVDLDRRRTPGFGRLECRQRVLRAGEAVAAVAAHMDPPGLARQQAEGHRRAGPPFARVW
jgi:hypothetical protein